MFEKLKEAEKEDFTHQITATEVSKEKQKPCLQSIYEQNERTIEYLSDVISQLQSLVEPKSKSAEESSSDVHPGAANIPAMDASARRLNWQANQIGTLLKKLKVC